MKERFKSALERIEADEALVSRTHARMKMELARGQAPTNFVKGRIYAMKKFAIAACLALLLIGGGFVWATPTSYMCVDINPSIELGLNTFDQVVRVKALNDDGQAVLDELGKIKGMDLDDAVELIVDGAIDQGFMKESDEDSYFVQLTAVSDDDKKAAKLLKDAGEGTKKGLDENETEADVSQAAISHARRDAANDYGISPGKLNLLQKLWEAQGNEIPADADDKDLAGIFEEILALENEDLEDDPPYAEGKVKDIMKAIKEERGKGNPNLTVQDSDDEDDDDVTPGKGKAAAPGQLKKMNGSTDDDQVVYLPNGKVKKNGQGVWGIDDNGDNDDDDDENDDEDDEDEDD